MSRQVFIASESIIPLRSAPSDSAEMVSQLLFGEKVELLEVYRQWRKVRVLSDWYEGWADEKMLTACSGRNRPALYVKKPIQAKKIIDGRKTALWLSPGAELPEELTEKAPGSYVVRLAENTEVIVSHVAVDVTRNHNWQNLSYYIRKFLGVPYLWGGKSIWGIDCSALVQICFRLCGNELSRDAIDQAEEGGEIEFGDHLPGDLAFFSKRSNKIVHVGIVGKNEQIYHAHGCVRLDKFTEDGIINKINGNLTHHFRVIKRIK